ncbi:hypothetical protein DFS34DRAFT_663601 [Phlyctochytrium arcticum]|nr:hypothetical protein DFS34DRAFT_663601 [Phlyctochytrium arcticum]
MKIKHDTERNEPTKRRKRALSSPASPQYFQGVTVPLYKLGIFLQGSITAKVAKGNDSILVSIKDWEYFYVCSWAVTAHDLARLLVVCEENGIEPPEAWRRGFDVEVGKARNHVHYIRYVGKCKGPETPFGRMRNDLAQRSSGLMHEFTTALNQVAADSYASGKVYEIPQVRLPCFAAPSIRDDRERILIAFFGHDALLNQQLGGFYPTCTPNADDHRLFQSLQTEFFRLFRDVNSKEPATNLLNKLEGICYQLGQCQPYGSRQFA